MAALMKSHWYDLSTHHRWEDVITMILGAIVVVSPVLAGGSESMAIGLSTGLAGILIVAMGFLETVNLRRWEEWVQLLCGAWLVAAPFLLGYAGTLRTVHMVIGAIVGILALLELWQDSGRTMES